MNVSDKVNIKHLIPAILYTIINYLYLSSHDLLSPAAFQLLNQMKHIFTALFCYLFLNKYVERKFFFLVIGVCIITIDELRFTYYGVLYVTIASFLSGIAACLSEYQMENTTANTFSRDLSIFSILTVLYKTSLFQPFEGQIRPSALIPCITQALGGLAVGILTKNEGAIAKNSCMIYGMFLTNILNGFRFSRYLSLAFITISEFKNLRALIDKNRIKIEKDVQDI
jgi:hypothetical protein